MALPLYNNASAGTNQDAVTTGNSGGGSGNAWDSIQTGTGTTAKFETGTFGGSAGCYSFATSATSANTYLTWNSSSVNSHSRTYGRAYFAMSSFAATPSIVRVRGAGNQIFRVTVSTGGLVQLRNSANSVVATGTFALTASTWYRLSWDVTVGASATGTLKIYSPVYGTTVVDTITTATGNFGTSNVDEFNFGIIVATSNHAAMWIDDIAVSTTAEPGPSAQARANTEYLNTSLYTEAFDFGNPTTADQADGSPATVYSLGCLFRTSRSGGRARGNRWRAPTNSPTISCNMMLYQVSGESLLATSGAFTPTNGVDNDVSFSSPVNLTANADYVAAVLTNRYSYKTGAWPYTSGALTAPSGSNGRWRQTTAGNPLYPNNIGVSAYMIGPIVDYGTAEAATLTVTRARGVSDALQAADTATGSITTGMIDRGVADAVQAADTVSAGVTLARSSGNGLSTSGASEVLDFGTPTVPDQNDAAVYTLGTRFHSEIAGTAIGNRWRAPNNAPGISCRMLLYRLSDQALIASSGSFTPVPGVFNDVMFTTPAAIAAWTGDNSTVYVAAVLTDRYAYKTGGWPYSTDNLLAVESGNGRYVVTTAGNPAFPTTTPVSHPTYFVATLVQYQAGDVATAVLTRGRAVADTLSAADSAGQTLASSRAVADALTAADSPTSAAATPRAVADALAAADAAATVGVFGRAVADSVGLGDIPVSALALARAAADNLAAEETVARQLATVGDVGDGLDAADSVVFDSGVVRTVSDGLQAADNAVRALEQSREAISGSSIDDEAAAVYAGARDVTDAVTAADAAGSTIAPGRVVEDGMELVESLQVFRQLSRTAPDTANLQDSSAGQGQQARAATDTAAAVDLAGQLFAAGRQAGDAVQTQDSAATGGGAGRDGTDQLVLADAAGHVTVFTRATGDGVSGSDGAAAQAFTGRLGSDTLTSTDTAAAVRHGVRTVPDTLNLADTAIGGLAGSIAGADTLTAVDTAVGVAHLPPPVIRAAPHSIAVTSTPATIAMTSPVAVITRTI